MNIRKEYRRMTKHVTGKTNLHKKIVFDKSKWYEAPEGKYKSEVPSEANKKEPNKKA